ncbi:hypothetical protein [Micromonospora sp. NPDC048169]|uniref:hypothetical protein n=1 Tax=Micromonospora sp. NPDC048169 TaxID=3154711 RepID=UPI0033E51EA7
MLLDIGARIFVIAGLLWLLYVAASIAWQWWTGRDAEALAVAQVVEPIELDLERAA